MSERKVVEFENIRLEPADNGFVLEYCEKTEKDGSMDSCDYNYRKMVFNDGDEEALDLALSKMKEMYTFNRLRKGGASELTLPTTEGSVFKGMG